MKPWIYIYIYICECVYFSLKSCDKLLPCNKTTNTIGKLSHVDIGLDPLPHSLLYISSIARDLFFRYLFYIVLNYLVRSIKLNYSFE